MAGTKESPRQRMVGMMYLVLTALLALQVSSTIIEKFIALNENMEQTVAINASINADKLEGIKKSVVKRGNKSDEIILATQSSKLHKETVDLIAYMESLKRNLIEKAGGRDEEGKLKSANEETAIEVYMLGSDLQKGKAYELKARLNDYVKSINHDFKTSYGPMAMDGKDDKLYKNDAEHKNKDFAQLNFGQTPLAAALAVISEIETKVVAMENTVLTATTEKLGIKDFKVDKLIPMVRANSRFVPAGTPYQAEVFLAATSTGLNPQMNVGGQSLTVDQNGIGNYKFVASGGAYDPQGMLKKTWTASIKMKKPDGTDTLVQVSEDYTVVKPVIEFNSIAMESLYKNCGNKMAIKVPALGAYYHPDFATEGGILKKVDGQGTVTIQPQAPNVKVKVMNQGQLIGEKKFKVKLIPKPEVEIRVNNQLINPITGISKDVIRTISIKIIPDPEFAASQPEDAYYEVVEWNVCVARNRKVVGNQNPTKTVFNLGQMVALLNTNDNILVEVKKVRRRNYLGQWEDVNVSSRPFTFPVF
ncbi:MAG: protein involved in gliding motility GldM [Cytophagaceae bacterium]|jgi:gliding motility-associated protein GldM|nr:protein involved in gliding motility GldM [Cytophagaceae bacterium]